MDMDKILLADNVAEMLSDEWLREIGQDAVAGYRDDVSSRAEWEQNNADVLRMAMQVVQQKTFPWQGSACVEFPLMALACVNFQSRAVAEAVPGGAVAMCKGGMPLSHIEQQVSQNVQQQMQQQMQQAPLPDDPAHAQQMQQQMQQQIKQQVSQAVIAQYRMLEKLGEQLTFQMQELDDFEEKTDLLMAILPLAGCVIKKTFWDAAEKRNRSEVVLPNNFIVNYWATGDIDNLQRVSQWFTLAQHELDARIREGQYLDGAYEAGYTPDVTENVKDERQGLTQGRRDHADIEMLEQHTWLDLDEDGYAEPYVVTVDVRTQTVRRIVKRFYEDGVQRRGNLITRIIPQSYFTKYTFMQSPDGGWYGQGFGSLLKAINATVSGAINRLLDAGTLAVTAGGFLSKEIRIKGGEYAFRPNEWKRAECSAEVLKAGIVPLPVRGPDAVLMQLIEYLVGYSERVVGATDLMTGLTPGQNTPAETSRNTLEQGLKVYSGIMRRVYRAMQREFRLWYGLNQRHYEGSPWDELPANVYKMVPATMVFPAMNPNVMSDSARLTQQQALMQAAMAVPPGMYNLYEVQRRYLKALRVPDIDLVLPDPNGPLGLPPQAPMPMQVVQAKGQLEIQREQIKAQAKMGVEKEKLQLEVAKLMQQAEEVKAKVMLMEAQAANQKAQAGAEPVLTAVHAANTELEYMKAHHKGLLESVKVLQSLVSGDHNERGNMAPMDAATGNEAAQGGTASEAGGGVGGGNEPMAAPQ